MSGVRVALRSTDEAGDTAHVRALRAALATDGWDLRIDAHSVARRSAVAELVVHVLDDADSLVLDGLETRLIEHVRRSLWRKHNHRGRIVFYDVDELVLRLCETPPATVEADRKGR